MELLTSLTTCSICLTSEQLLNSYKQKQTFRVAVGKSKWINYTNFNPAYNLREILKDEIVFEIDFPKDSQLTLNQMQNQSYMAINEIGINLYNAGIAFEIWEHGGKSPHLHIHNLPIAHLEKDKLREFKKFFIKKFTPAEYLDSVDFSLCGIHLVALEWTNHWKNKYGVKRLLHKFNPMEDLQ